MPLAPFLKMTNASIKIEHEIELRLMLVHKICQKLSLFYLNTPGKKMLHTFERWPKTTYRFSKSIETAKILHIQESWCSISPLYSHLQSLWFKHGSQWGGIYCFILCIFWHCGGLMVSISVHYVQAIILSKRVCHKSQRVLACSPPFQRVSI